MVGNRAFAVAQLEPPRGAGAEALLETTPGDTRDEAADLVAQAQSGDQAALARIWESYRPLALSIAHRRRFLPTGVEEADVEQEAARALCELVLSYDARREVPLAAYLKRKLAWRVHHYLRDEARRCGHLALDSIDVDTVAGSVVEMPTPGIPDARVLRALRKLSPRQRAVIAGLFWRDRKTKELADELRISKQAVTALRRRAEGAIRRDLGGHDEV